MPNLQGKLLGAGLYVGYPRYQQNRGLFRPRKGIATVQSASLPLLEFDYI